MEDFILTAGEHRVLKRFQKRLQKRYNVEIQMPKTVTSVESDVVFASIKGDARNIECVKKFLSEKMNATEKVECKENVILITLSDSEEEPLSAIESEENVVDNHSYPENSPNLVDTFTMVNPLESSVCIIETPVISKRSSKRRRKRINDRTHYNEERKPDPLHDSVCIIESPVIVDSSSGLCRSIMNDENDSKEKREPENIEIRNEKVRSNGVLPSQPFEETELCEVSSTTGEVVPKKAKFSKGVGLTKELEEFIPLHKKRELHFEAVEPSKGSRDSLSNEEGKDVIVLDEPSSVVRQLRPVVIDGSNVAIEHGKVSQTFSVKGIQLAVDYFLNRGHTQVTAFVPKFRRFCNRKNFPTTDPEILDDLAKKQHVVFTPSRRLNGKCIASYDDRFIVQLASTNGGVIVSNDNYRDLVSENDSFKEVIENRLLMFCFVGDIFMVPSDPLGRNGPPLSEFLSFPPDVETS